MEKKTYIAIIVVWGVLLAGIYSIASLTDSPIVFGVGLTYFLFGCIITALLIVVDPTPRGK